MRAEKSRGEAITLATSRAFATVRGIPPWANTVEIEAPSGTLETITVGFGPRIKRIYFYDASVPAWINYSDAGIDRNTATSIALNAMQTDDRLYVGFAAPAEGLAVDVGSTNSAGTATSTWEAFLNASQWTDLSATDGTRSTRTFAQDGLVTWTVLQGWKAAKLADTGATDTPPSTERLYWVRQQPSAALADTSITLLEIAALLSNVVNAADDTLTGEDLVRITTTNGGKPWSITIDPDRYGAVELVSASITSAANINYYSVEQGR